jgi:TRAP-type C4-dicarboxylate transport system permease small subunit
MKLIAAVDGLNRLVCWLLAAMMLGMTLCTLWQVAVRFLLTGLGWNVAAPGRRRWRAI